MTSQTLQLLDLAQGPIFRAAFALMIFGVLRWLILLGLEWSGAYLTLRDKSAFWDRARARLLWQILPSIVMRATGRIGPAGFVYHTLLALLSLVMRLGVLLVPMFMLAHVYLWERTFGLRWPALPGAVADTLAIITIVSTVAVFLGRLYSPDLRRIEPGWSFATPLVVLLPFLSGYLAMHPLMSPFSHDFVMLVHVLSACVLFVMIPFGRLLSSMHVPLATYLPEAAWASADERFRVTASATQPG